MTNLSDLPADILNIIALKAVEVNEYYDRYDAAATGAALYCVSKSCFETRYLSQAIMRAVIGAGGVGGFDLNDDGWMNEDLNTKSGAWLKGKCAELGVAVSGTKATLIDRLRKRVRQRFTLVTSRDDVNKLCNIRLGVITAHSAWNVYGIHARELTELRMIIRDDGIRVYRLREVRDLSLAKYGDLAGLHAARRAREEARVARRVARTERENKRRAELRAALEACGCGEFMEAAKARAFVRDGLGNIGAITQEYEEYKFLRDHTDYVEMLEENPGMGHDMVFLSTIRRYALRNWAHGFNRKVDALECAHLPRSLRAVMERWPRYMWRVEQL